jgi:hypothetical protein
VNKYPKNIKVRAAELVSLLGENATLFWQSEAPFNKLELASPKDDVRFRWNFPGTPTTVPALKVTQDAPSNTQPKGSGGQDEEIHQVPILITD